MGRALLVSPNDPTLSLVPRSKSPQPRIDPLVDLSNVPSDLNSTKKRFLLSSRANETSDARKSTPKGQLKRTRLTLRARSSIGTDRRIKSENQSQYYDGPCDSGSELLEFLAPRKCGYDPRTRQTRVGDPVVDGLVIRCRKEQDSERLAELFSRHQSDEEDLLLSFSDVERSDSQSTTDPQSPQTPLNDEFGSSLFERKSSSTNPQKARCLDTRLRPSQRPEIVSSSPKRSRNVDRFAGLRRPTTESRDSFFMSSPVPQLNQQQRVYRRMTGLSDPFEPLPSHPGQTSHQSLPFLEQPMAQNTSFRASRILGLRSVSVTSANRQPRRDTVWSIGGNGSVPDTNASHDVQSRFRRSRSQGRVHTSKFLRGSAPGEDRDMYEKRLALALDVDQAGRILAAPSSPSTAVIRSIQLPLASSCSMPQAKASLGISSKRMVWRENKWMRDDRSPILEAPLLRDDFYCSVLAYSRKADRLAVALGFKVYLWSEDEGTVEPPSALDVTPLRSAYVCSLAFSSDSGGRAILAVGRGDGRIIMWSPLDQEHRFLRFRTTNAAAHLSFRPSIIRRPSQRHASVVADTEVFLVGDDLGIVSVYLVEWPEDSERFLFGWHGSICLQSRVSVHTQQICGIAWSPTGDFFATGGNDNLCCLFQTSTILDSVNHSHADSSIDVRRDSHGNIHLTAVTQGTEERTIRADHLKNVWKLNAAVKAIAFCPWQPGLLAAGGGSNDRRIHFYHSFSGVSLATIDCAAQITSLVWSSNRREIAATFGFAQPEHPFRVAVYAWPSCEQIVAIPWMSEMRALHAIAYPCRPEYARKAHGSTRRMPQGAEESCIVIAGSDGSIKFHEIWSERRKATAPHQGLLGGSDILGSLHGIDKEGIETIR